MSVPKVMCCCHCLHRQTLSIGDAKTLGWQLHVGGGYCPECCKSKLDPERKDKRAPGVG